MTKDECGMLNVENNISYRFYSLELPMASYVISYKIIFMMWQQAAGN
jgi:hypothetical protein